MRRTEINGVELEFDVRGSGDPLLFISSVLADGFAPLLAEPALADRYQLISYHRRGWVGSSTLPTPVTVADHAADAAALLEYLGAPSAHVAGHSTGAVVAVQLALDAPAAVRTLVLLEPFVLSVPGGEAVLQQAGPAFAAYADGDHETAWAMFLSAASGLDWPTCRALLEQRIPGVVAQAVMDADTLFGVELPAIAAWALSPERAAAVRCPTLSVLGTATLPLFGEVAELLRTSLADVEECRIEGAGHLLHIQRPAAVARPVAEFLEAHRLPGDALAQAPGPRRDAAPWRAAGRTPTLGRS